MLQLQNLGLALNGMQILSRLNLETRPGDSWNGAVEHGDEMQIDPGIRADVRCARARLRIEKDADILTRGRLRSREHRRRPEDYPT